MNTCEHTHEYIRLIHSPNGPSPAHVLKHQYIHQRNRMYSEPDRKTTHTHTHTHTFDNRHFALLLECNHNHWQRKYKRLARACNFKIQSLVTFLVLISPIISYPSNVVVAWSPNNILDIVLHLEYYPKIAGYDTCKGNSNHVPPTESHRQPLHLDGRRALNAFVLEQFERLFCFLKGGRQWQFVDECLTSMRVCVCVCVCVCV